jgi:hypothetical protein
MIITTWNFVLTKMMAVFWDVAPYSLVDIDDVSEKLTTSIIRAMSENLTFVLINFDIIFSSFTTHI